MQNKIITAAIIGKPNAGKSSLLNLLIREKISIVTHKVQTTRSMITGIVTIGDVQIILRDTPGIFSPNRRLEKAMVRMAWSCVSGVDLVMLILDSTHEMDEDTMDLLNTLQKRAINPVFLLNKVDLPHNICDSLEEKILAMFPQSQCLRISAITGQGVHQTNYDVVNDANSAKPHQSLLDLLLANAHVGEWLYHEDEITNLDMRFLTQEITREVLFFNVHHELPYDLTVETELWEEEVNDRDEHEVKINQVIFVTREGQKRIIIGQGGQMIKKIGSIARTQIEALLGYKVHLFLFVKVRDWQNNPEFYRNIGLSFNE
ncbi:GTPase Era [Candidatus Sarmatiella mevalonica]|uniref:GTPase Era n=1 Tax=Candidatus Sarmatiella mevalonica TaxID=2770581 RepID=UPI001924F0D7|nr:GTPase Era [Candidatus Sarmatiella mevalonica]